MATKLTTAQTITKSATAYKEAGIGIDMIPVAFDVDNIRMQMASAMGVDSQDIEVGAGHKLAGLEVTAVYRVEAVGEDYVVAENEDVAQDFILGDDPQDVLGALDTLNKTDAGFVYWKD